MSDSVETMENSALQSPTKPNREIGMDMVEQHAEEPPILQKCASQSDNLTVDATNNTGEGAPEDDISSAPVLSAMVTPEVDPDNALRSPPKLQPAVVMTKRKSDESIKTPSKPLSGSMKNTPNESIKTPYKPLSGSMKNTPASLSIIDTPSTKSVRSTRSSIDPTFAAKQRSFLNRVHNALTSVRIDDASCESDPEPAPGENGSLSDDNEYVPGYGDMPARRPSALSNAGNKRRRDDSSLSKGKISASYSHVHSGHGLVSDKEVQEPLKKKRVVSSPSGKDKYSDLFCWICHRDEPEVGCATCPRAYHSNCLRRAVSHLDSEWVCPECVTILKAENQETRSKALKMLTLDQLCNLLMFAVQRMKSCSGAADFEGPVDADLVPTYHDFIVNPMYLSLLEKNIKKKCYGSTEAFVADATWLVHNSIIFNSVQSKLTSNAKNILRLCKQEMAEIENCPDCYNYSYTADDNWFIQVCQKPHVLLWAKLKGFPYWPAKAMKCNSDSIDVRFFGAHDRAWVPFRDCYLYSQENPNPTAPTKPQPTHSQPKKRNPKNNLDICIEEVELHIQLLKERFSDFQYAPLKTHIDPKKLDSHLKYMLPKYDFSESNASPSKKTVLPKRRSFEFKISASSGTAVKRMKADSSSTQPLNIIRLFRTAQESTPKETDQLQKVSLDEKVIKISSPPVAVSKEDSELSVKTCGIQDVRKNGVHPSKENEDHSQSKLNSKTVPVTLNSVTPGQSHTFITPLKLPESTSIELRHKKKDARKIGLVDRIQEKISLWVSQGGNNVDGSKVEGEKKNISKVLSSQAPESGKEENQSEKVQVTHSSCEDSSENQNDAKVKGEKNSDVSLNCELKSMKRDLSTSAKTVPKESITHMIQSLSSKQPKIILEKLVFEKESAHSQNLPVKEESLDEESKVSLSFQDGKKGNVHEMKTISDDGDSESDLVLSSKVNSTLICEAADPVTSTTPLSADATEPTDGNVSPVSAQSIQIKRLKASDTLAADSGPVVDEIKGEKACSAPAEGVIEEKIRKASKIISSAEIKKDSSPKLDSVSASVTPNQSSNCSTNKIDGGSMAVDEEVDADKPIENRIPNVSSQTPLKVLKSFEIRARPLSELKNPSRSKFVPIAPKEVSNTADVHVNISNEAQIEPDSCHPKGGQLHTLKSLLSKNAVTLRVGKPTESVKSEPETSISTLGSAESKPVTPHSVPLTLPNTKAKTIVVQAGKSVVHIESPPKPATSSCIVTSPTQRLVHGATSILKVKNALESNPNVVLSSKEKAQTPQIRVVSGAASLPTSKKSSSSSSKLQTSPTYVTLTQTTNGRPIVRRVLPQGITLSSSAKAVRVSGGKITAMPQVSEISVNALVTEKNTSKAALPKETLPLSIASECSQQHASSTLAHPEIESKASPFVTSNALLCKGPVSGELRSQANKMTDIFMGCLKDCLTEMGTQGSLEAQVRCLQLEMEHMQWRHQQEMEELRHNTELVIAEIRDRMKVETEHAVNIAVANAYKEKEVAIATTKEKQWCAFCKKEAMFYCCWNTSYCDHQCQQGHWPVHSLTCSQNASSSVDHDHLPGCGNEQTQPAKMRRIVIHHKEGVTPPLLKKC